MERVAPVELTLAPRSPEAEKPSKKKVRGRSKEKDAQSNARSKPESTTSPLVWVGGGTAAAGAVVGTVTGLMAFSVYGDVSARCEGGVQCPPATHGDIDRGESLGTISTIAFVVAGIGAGVLVYGLLNPKVESTAMKKEPKWIASPFGVAGTF